jgi:hypothetical protein
MLTVPSLRPGHTEAAELLFRRYQPLGTGLSAPDRPTECESGYTCGFMLAFVLLL